MARTQSSTSVKQPGAAEAIRKYTESLEIRTDLTDEQKQRAIEKYTAGADRMMEVANSLKDMARRH